MAESLSIGNELKDAYKPTDKWVKAGLTWLTDLDWFYKERAAIEREYATKLKTLSAEAFKKKAKVSTAVSVGENPVVTPGSLESASLVAWTEILGQTENIAKERDAFASSLERRVASQISEMASRYDGIRQRWKGVNEDLVKARDSYYDEVTKAKKDYDASCQAMESQRSKTERSENDRSKHKSEKREFEMNAAKNAYLIKINVANRLKDKYFYQDLPEVLDGLQTLNEAKVAKLNSIWLTASALERSTNEKLIKMNDAMDEVIRQNVPTLDTSMFIKHNMTDWSEPADFYYIPSSIWHDDETIITSPAELEVLKKQLSKSSQTYSNMQHACEEEKNTLGELIQARNKAFGNSITEVKLRTKEEMFKYDDLMVKSLVAMSKFSLDDSKRVVAEVEVETIQSAAEGKDLTLTQPIETKKRGVFGGLFKGKHRNETSAPVEQYDDEVHSLTSSMSRVTTSTGKGSRLFGALRGRAESVMTTSSAASASTGSGKALYAYQAGGEDEVSLIAGEALEVIDLDDGSGWTKVRSAAGEGLVPTSYLSIVPAASTNGGKKQGPKVAPRKGAKRVQYMEILYDYEPQGDDELGVGVGDKVLVVTEDDGSGWTEGEIEGIRGVFPTSYGKIV
ncbi:unnamed protein product [Kuraishia capsulata CBS 1993]|uniref:Protein BZZ1 n=1 Tax=Kuraishia capsulata CBS 1993 TaxID=1382522 RepID=W6MI32_9ASCO|nr:uncharacterized protein KUCA_T00002020001 [Kuraishia capsulata CBS 1993]CDK26049.1 unnamed protein product [Kuraishia capsulata CBS 1993]